MFMASPAKFKKELKLRMYAFFVLYFLRERNMSGYGLAKAIKRETKGFFSSTPGNIYPVLKVLEVEGLVKSSSPSGKRRKTMYKITSKGKTTAVELAKSYKERFEKITSFFAKAVKRG